MENLLKTKNRILSLQTTKKITKAIQLVASAKIKQAKKLFASSTDFYQTQLTLFDNLVNFHLVNKNLILNHKKMIKNDENTILYIVILADLGLCGAYNSNIIKTFLSNFTSHDLVIFIGKKSKIAAKKIDKNQIWLTILDYQINIFDQKKARLATYQIIKQMQKKLATSKPISQIKFIYTEYVNSLFWQVKTTTFFDVNLPGKPDAFLDNTIWETSLTKIVKTSFWLYLQAFLLHCLTSAKLAEMSARQNAMESASDNATDLIDHLKLIYNQTRQSSITQEILEIIGGTLK